MQPYWPNLIAEDDEASPLQLTTERPSLRPPSAVIMVPKHSHSNRRFKQIGNVGKSGRVPTLESEVPAGQHHIGMPVPNGFKG